MARESNSENPRAGRTTDEPSAASAKPPRYVAEDFSRAASEPKLEKSTPEPGLNNIANVQSPAFAGQVALPQLADTMNTIQAQWKSQTAPGIANTALSLENVSETVNHLTKNLDFSGIAPSFEACQKVLDSFKVRQSTLLSNLEKALHQIEEAAYPRNLRSIEDLNFEDVETIVMDDGIALYGVPRSSIVKELVNAKSFDQRNEVLEQHSIEIANDCRDVIKKCSSGPAGPYVSFAHLVLDALDQGHVEAAQALAGSLIDTMTCGYFEKRGRNKFTQKDNKNYDELTVGEFIAFAPMWQMYQSFPSSSSGSVPRRLNRHATAHAVCEDQYRKGNAVQASMFACSFIYWIDQETNMGSQTT